MNSVNPAFTLRNYLLEEAIRKAEKGDFKSVDRLLELSKSPFSANTPIQMQ
jgi:uncharacterized protein YdiU (UPF0061 family)